MGGPQPALPRLVQGVGVIAMDVAGRFPALHRLRQQFAAFQQRRQFLFADRRFQTMVVGDPGGGGDPQRAHGVGDETLAHSQRLGCRGGRIQWRIEPRQHALGEVVHALEIVPPRHHQLTQREAGLQPALLRFPLPPPRLARHAARCAGEIRGAHRAVGADPVQQRIHLGAMLVLHAQGVTLGPVLQALGAPGTMPADVGGTDQGGLVRPAFGQLAGGQRLVQPVRRVVAQAGMQHQVRAACHHVDGVDLQQAHAFDRCHHIVAARPSLQWLQQPLCRQLQRPRLPRGQHAACRWRRHGSFTMALSA